MSAPSYEVSRELAELKRRLYDLERATSAVEAEDPLPSAGELQAVVCLVADTRVAWPLSAVERVVPAAALAPLPETPPWVQGLLNLGGRALPVLDVAARIERRRRALELNDKFVICRHGEASVGLVVQDVLGVRALELGEKTAALGSSVPFAPYVHATLRDADGLILLFSLRRLLATSDIPSLEDEAASEGPSEFAAR